MGDIVRQDHDPATGEIVRREFGAEQIERKAETASTAVAARATAQTQAMYVVAQQRPRDWDDIRVRLLKECRRPGFAKTARYSKPVGGKPIVGPSIRFAESCIQSMGNIFPNTTTTYDDAQKRIIGVAVTDLERNVTYSSEIVVEKTVERKSLKDGQIAVGSRINSYGERVYLVPATEDDLLNKQNAMISKSMRTHALRLIPGDIIEECMVQVVKTQNDADAKDPDAARKEIADGFAQFRVMPSDLKEFLDHDIGTASPAELADLRLVYVAMRDGVGSWPELLTVRKREREEAAKASEEKAASGAPKSLKDDLKEKAAAKAASKATEKKEDPKPATAPVNADDPDQGP